MGSTPPEIFDEIYRLWSPCGRRRTPTWRRRCSIPKAAGLASAALLAAAVASGRAPDNLQSAVAPTSGEEILVFAAASLTESLQEIGRTFERTTGNSVRFSFGASSDLARQIRAGAPADAFFSADTARMDELERAGLVLHQDRREFLGNSLVVIVPVRSPLQIRSPRDLLSVDRIALADPAAVPAGIYARKWLEHQGLWERIQKRVVPALDVRAALAAVETEALPAGIVYRTDARISKRVRIAYEAGGKPEILYSVAPIVSSDKKAAKEFVRYLASEEAARVFRGYGFGIRGGR